MDEYSGKRAINELVVSRKGSGLRPGVILRDTANNRDRNAQFCNRLGCRGRLNSMKGTQLGSLEKPKSSRPSSFTSSSGKEIIGSSSSTGPSVRKSLQTPRKKLSAHLETDSSETSSVPDESEVLELIPPPGKIQRGLHPEADDTESSEITPMEVGSSSIVSNTRPRRNFHQKSGFTNQATLMGSSVALASKTAGQGARHGANASRKKDIGKKRLSEIESSSSARGKKSGGPSSEYGRNSISSYGVSISDSRRARNWTPSRDNGVASVRTRRSINGNTRPSSSNQGIRNNLLPTEPSITIPQMPQPEISIGANDPSLSHQFSIGSPSSFLDSYSQSGSSSENLHSIMPISPTEVGISRSSMNRDSLRRYNMDGIAEVLLALERIEQDEELTYEQLLVLETNLFLGGLSFHDQHRDMRLDIDNMSYEELLALEEKMGTVSTALTEEALSKCLERSIYHTLPTEPGTMDCAGDGDDVKCSICQEEYVVGDEVGKLQCEHGYHVACIHQWLRVKNWCPVCKASAALSSSSS
ncbi:hypothetical protein PVL29_004080 [Vitis rotundifolia]|uniref:RING-type E3 ubiquitin transferase n=1 Tax=Vitis rotundifolia TaxID=103349 RepID=A0AA39A720_VITRO|nr:hypothetical protein PVL29_004080 [Vitis rotundifolia]